MFKFLFYLLYAVLTVVCLPISCSVFVVVLDLVELLLLLLLHLNFNYFAQIYTFKFHLNRCCFTHCLAL